MPRRRSDTSTSRSPTSIADFVGFSQHKWLAAPLGTGALWIRGSRRLASTMSCTAPGTGLNGDSAVSPESSCPDTLTRPRREPDHSAVDSSLVVVPTSRPIPPMSQPPQSFANHARLVPGYHYVTAPLILVYLLWSIWRAATLRDSASVHAMVGALALFGVYAYTRLFPLKAQDRIIRLEERLRLARLLPADLQSRIDDLTPRQLIALRFASDGEVEGLVRQVLAGTLVEPKAIKQAIRSWRADHLRV
jgi:hypothetical protein